MDVEPVANPKMVIKDLNFYYGNYRALKDINLSIPEKMVTAFIGPSGCGKSTLLRTIGGFIRPEKGQVLLNGEDVAERDVTEVAALRAIYNAGYAAGAAITPSAQTQDFSTSVAKPTDSATKRR